MTGVSLMDRLRDELPAALGRQIISDCSSWPALILTGSAQVQISCQKETDSVLNVDVLSGSYDVLLFP